MNILLLGIWTYYFPLLYSFISMIGACLHLFCTPRGFSKMFTVMGKILSKPQFLHDIAQDRDTVVLEEEYLRRKIEHLCGRDASDDKFNFANPDLIYTQIHSNNCRNSSSNNRVRNSFGSVNFGRKNSKQFHYVPKTSENGINGSKVGFDALFQRSVLSISILKLNRLLLPYW